MTVETVPVMAVRSDSKIGNFSQFYDDDFDDDDDDNHFIISLEDNGDEDEPDFVSGGNSSDFVNEKGLDSVSDKIVKETSYHLSGQGQIQNKTLYASSNMLKDAIGSPEKEILTFPTSCISKPIKQPQPATAHSHVFTQPNFIQSHPPLQDSVNLHLSSASSQAHSYHLSPKELSEHQSSSCTVRHLAQHDPDEAPEEITDTIHLNPESEVVWSEAVFKSRPDGAFIRTDVSTGKNTALGVSKEQERHPYHTAISMNSSIAPTAHYDLNKHYSSASPVISNGSNLHANVPRLSGPFSKCSPHIMHSNMCSCIMCEKTVTSNNISKKMQSVPSLTPEEVQIIEGNGAPSLKQRQRKVIKTHGIHSRLSADIDSVKINSVLPKLTPSRELSVASSLPVQEWYRKPQEEGQVSSDIVLKTPTPPSLLHKSVAKRDVPKVNTTCASSIMNSQNETAAPVQNLLVQTSQQKTAVSTVMVVSSAITCKPSTTLSQSNRVSVSSSGVPLVFQGLTGNSKLGSLLIGTPFPSFATSQCVVTNSQPNCQTTSSAHSPIVLSSQHDPKFSPFPNKVFLKPNDPQNPKVSRMQPPGTVNSLNNKSTIPTKPASALNTSPIRITKNIEAYAKQHLQASKTVSLLKAPVPTPESSKVPVAISSGTRTTLQNVLASKPCVTSGHLPQGPYQLVYLSAGEVLLCRTPAQPVLEVNSKTFAGTKHTSKLISQPQQAQRQVHSEPLMVNGNTRALNSVLKKAEQIDLTKPGKVRIVLKNDGKAASGPQKVSNSSSPTVTSSSQSITSSHQETVPISAPKLSKAPFVPCSKPIQKSPTKNPQSHSPKSPNVGVTGSTLLKLIDTHIENQHLNSSESALLHLIKGACKDPELLAATCKIAKQVEAANLSKTPATPKNVVISSPMVPAAKTSKAPSTTLVETKVTQALFTSSLLCTDMPPCDSRAGISIPSNHFSNTEKSPQSSMNKDPSSGTNSADSRSKTANTHSIASVTTVSVSSNHLDYPHPPQEGLPASYVEDWVNQSKTFMSNNRVDDLFSQEIRAIDRRLTNEVLPYYNQPDANFKTPPKKAKSKPNKSQPVVSRESSTSDSVLKRDADSLPSGQTIINERETRPQAELTKNKPAFKSAKFNSNSSLANKTKHLSSVVTSSKGIKLKIRLSEKLKQHKAMKKKSLGRNVIKSHKTPSLHHSSETKIVDSETIDTIDDTHNKSASDMDCNIALIADHLKQSRAETAEEMFQRFQEQAQEEVYKAQLGVGCLSRSLRPARATVAFLDKLPMRDMGSAERKKKKMETDQTESDVKPSEKDLQETSSPETLLNDKTTTENREKKTCAAKKKKLSIFHSNRIGKAKDPKIGLSHSDHPNLKEDSSFPLTKNVYCSNILAGHKVFVKFNTYENNATGRCFLIPFFNIGGKRRQFDVEDVAYFNKAVLDFEREERSCARHLLYFCREGNKASFLRKEGNFGASQLHEKSYAKKSFTLEGFKMSAVKPKSNETHETWKVDKEVAIEIDTAEVDNDIEVDFDGDYLVSEGVGFGQTSNTAAKEIVNVHSLVDESSDIRLKEPVPSSIPDNMLVRVPQEKCLLDTPGDGGLGNKNIVKVSNTTENGHLAGKVDDSSTDRFQGAVMPHIVSREESLITDSMATDSSLVEIKKEKADYIEYGKDLSISTEALPIATSLDFFQPLFPKIEIKKEPVDDNFDDDLCSNIREIDSVSEDGDAQNMGHKKSSQKNSDLRQEILPFAGLFKKQSSDERPAAKELPHPLSENDHCQDAKSIARVEGDSLQSEIQALTSLSILCTEVLSCDAGKVQVSLRDQQATKASEVQGCNPIKRPDMLTNVLKGSQDSMCVEKVDGVDKINSEVTATCSGVEPSSSPERQSCNSIKPSGVLAGECEGSKDSLHFKKVGVDVGNSVETATCSEVEPSSPESPAPSSPLSESSEVVSSSDLEESDIDDNEFSPAEAHLSHTSTPSVDLMADPQGKSGPGQHKITSLVESLRQRLTQQTPTLPSWIASAAPPVVHSRIKSKKKKLRKHESTDWEHVATCSRSQIVSESTTTADSPQIVSESNTAADSPQIVTESNTAADYPQTLRSNPTILSLLEAPLASAASQPPKVKDTLIATTTLSSASSAVGGPTNSITSSIPKVMFDTISSRKEVPMDRDVSKVKEFSPTQTLSQVSETSTKIQDSNISQTIIPEPSGPISTLPNDTSSLNKNSESNPKPLSLPTSLEPTLSVLRTNQQPSPTNSASDVQLKVKQEVVNDEYEISVRFKENDAMAARLESNTSEEQEPEIIPQVPGTRENQLSHGNQLSCRSTPSDFDIEVGSDDLPETAMGFQPIVPEICVDVDDISVNCEEDAASCSSSESSCLSPVASVVDFLHKRTQEFSRNKSGGSSISKSPKKPKGVVSSNQSSNIAKEENGSVTSYLTQKYSKDMTPGAGVWHTIKGPRLRRAAFKRPAAGTSQDAADTPSTAGPISLQELSQKPSLSEIFGIPVDIKTISESAVKLDTNSECKDESNAKLQSEKTDKEKGPDFESEYKITLKIRGSKKQVARKRTSPRNQRKDRAIKESLQIPKSEPLETESSTNMPSEGPGDNGTVLVDGSSPATQSQGELEQVARKRTSPRNQKKDGIMKECLQVPKSEPLETESSSDKSLQCLEHNATILTDISIPITQSDTPRGELVKSPHASDTSSVKSKNSARNLPEALPKVRLTWRQLSKLSAKQQKEVILEKQQEEDISERHQIDFNSEKQKTDKVTPCTVLLSRLEDTDLSSTIEPINPFTFRVKKETHGRQDFDWVKKEPDDSRGRDEGDFPQINKGKALKRKKKKTVISKAKKGSAKPKKDLIDHFASMLDSLRKKALQLEEEAMKKQQEEEAKRTDEIAETANFGEINLQNVEKEEPPEEICTNSSEIEMGNISIDQGRAKDNESVDGATDVNDKLRQQKDPKDHEMKGTRKDERNGMEEKPGAKPTEKDEELNKVPQKDKTEQNDMKEDALDPKIGNEEKVEANITKQVASNNRSDDFVVENLSDTNSVTCNSINGIIDHKVAVRLESGKKVHDEDHAKNEFNEDHLRANELHNGENKNHVDLSEREDNGFSNLSREVNVESDVLKNSHNLYEKSVGNFQNKIKSVDVAIKKAEEDSFSAKYEYSSRKLKDGLEEMQENDDVEDHEEEDTSLDWEEPGALVIHLPDNEQVDETVHVPEAKEEQEKFPDSPDSPDVLKNPEPTEEVETKENVGSYNLENKQETSENKEPESEYFDDNKPSKQKTNEEQGQSKPVRYQQCENKESSGKLSYLDDTSFSFPKTDVVLSSVLDEDLASCLGEKSAKKDEMAMFEHQEDLEGDDMGIIPQEEVERLLGLCDEDSEPMVLPGLGPVPNLDTIVREGSPLNKLGTGENLSIAFSSSNVLPVAPCNPELSANDEIRAKSSSVTTVENESKGSMSSQTSENMDPGTSSQVYRLPSRTTVLSENKVFGQETATKTTVDLEEEKIQTRGKIETEKEADDLKAKQMQQLPKLNLKLDASAVAAIQKAKTAFLKKKNLKEKRNLRNNAVSVQNMKADKTFDPQFKQDMEFYMRSTSRKNLDEYSSEASSQSILTAEQEYQKKIAYSTSLTVNSLDVAETEKQDLVNAAGSSERETSSYQKETLQISSQPNAKNALEVSQVDLCGLPSSIETTRKRKVEDQSEAEPSCHNANKLKKVESIFDDTDIFKEPTPNLSSRLSVPKSKSFTNKPSLPVSELLKKTKGIDISKLKMKLNPVLSKSMIISSSQNLISPEKNQTSNSTMSNKASVGSKVCSTKSSPQNSNNPLKARSTSNEAINQEASWKNLDARETDSKAKQKPIPNLNTAKLCSLLKNIQKKPAAVESSSTAKDSESNPVSPRGLQQNNSRKRIKRELRGSSSEPEEKNSLHVSQNKVRKGSMQQRFKKASTAEEAVEKSERSFFDCLSTDQTEIWEEAADS